MAHVRKTLRECIRTSEGHSLSINLTFSSESYCCNFIIYHLLMRIIMHYKAVFFICISLSSYQLVQSIELSCLKGKKGVELSLSVEIKRGEVITFF